MAGCRCRVQDAAAPLRCLRGGRYWRLGRTFARHDNVAVPRCRLLELRGSITTIEAITASPALQGDDLPAFRAEALRVLATQPSWLDITLSRPSGEKVLDALQGVMHPGQRVLDPASVARAVSTRQVVVGNVGTS